MSREHWVLLHAAFEELSRWPPPVRKEVLRWLAPGGRPVVAPAVTAEDWPEVWRPPSKQKLRTKPKPFLKPHKPDRPRILELDLIEAMRNNPGASVAQLAAIAGCGKSRALWRLHALAERGEIEKDNDGHWRLVQDAIDVA
jgi:hypothetical protein